MTQEVGPTIYVKYKTASCGMTVDPGGIFSHEMEDIGNPNP